MRYLKKIYTFYIEQSKSQKGFTLVELLIYMGILSILIYVLSSIFTTIIDVKLESESTSSVDQDNQYILTRLFYDMNQATGISLPTAGQTGSSLQITVNSINYTYSLDASNNLVLAESGVGTFQLNSANTQVANLSFQRIGTGGSSDTIDVQYTLQSRGVRGNGNPETRSVETVLGLP